MFPQFAAKLDMLKASAQEMMDCEEDPNQQDIIAQQFAEASLTLLRQLRYHCPPPLSPLPPLASRFFLELV